MNVLLCDAVTLHVTLRATLNTMLCCVAIVLLTQTLTSLDVFNLEELKMETVSFESEKLIKSTTDCEKVSVR